MRIHTNFRIVTGVVSVFLMLLMTGGFSFPSESPDLPQENSKTNKSAGAVKGFVVDDETGEPLSDVNIVLQNTSLGAATSAEGYYLIENIPPGRYTIIVSRVGYQTIEQEIEIGEKETRTLSFSLPVQPLEMEEIVVQREMLIGSPDRLNGIPGSAHYIDQRKLEKYSYNDIHRVLREIPGINIQEEDGYGLRPNIGLRGTGSERSEKITLMEDGVLIAPAPYSAPAAYYFPTIGRMQAIEIRKGSSQIKYGPYTTGGALNLISTEIPNKFRGYAKLIGGEDNMRTIHASVGDSYRNFGFLAETYQAKADGFKELDNGGNTGFDKKDYMVKLRLNTNPTAKVYQQLTFKMGQTDETSNETYLGLTDADFSKTPFRRYAGSREDQMNTEHRSFLLRHFIQPSSFLDITTTVYDNDFSRNWYKLDKVKATADGGSVSISNILQDPETYHQEYNIITGSATPEGSLGVKANNRAYDSRGIQSVAGIQFDQWNASHEIEVGVRFHTDQIDRFQWVDIYEMDNGIMKLAQAGTPGTESNRVEEADVFAAFVQYKLSVGRLSAIPGFRFEDITQKRNDYGKNDPERTGKDLKTRQNNVKILIPGIGFDYKFNPLTSAFVGVHKGFAPPGSKEGTKPEESINYEAGVRYLNHLMNVQAVVFFNDYKNLLGPDLAAIGGTGSGNLFNGGRAEVKGLELALNIDVAPWMKVNAGALPVRIAYTYTDAKFGSNFVSEFAPWGEVRVGYELPYVPRHQLFTSMGFETRRWFFEVSAKYTGQMRTQAGTGDFVPLLSTDAHTVVDLSAEYHLTDHNSLFAGVRNLTDEVYVAARRPAGIRPGLPRTILGGIKTTF